MNDQDSLALEVLKISNAQWAKSSGETNADDLRALRAAAIKRLTISLES